MGIPSTGIPYRFPSDASPGHDIGLTEGVGFPIPNSHVEIEMVVWAVQVVEQQQLSAFATASAVVVVAGFELPDFAPMQYLLGPEASLPFAALDQVVPFVALVVLVELASFDIVADTQVVAMAVAVLDTVAVGQA